MNEIKRIKCFVNQKPKSEEVSQHVKKLLEENGFELVEDNFDLAIAIGGDGTFLHMVKEIGFNDQVYVVGINSGTLGFAQDISVEEVEEFIQSLKRGEFFYEEIGLAETEVITKEGTSKFYDLNEMVIRNEELNTTSMNVYVDGVLLENFKGDGLCIATSFGSTAYNLSFGGSMVYNTFHTLQITPIAPLNNKSTRTLFNSVVLPGVKVITIEPVYPEEAFLLTVDGDNQVYRQVEKIHTTMTGRTIKCIRKKDYNFIQKINEKFLK